MNNRFEGPWKKKNLSELGIVTQCIAPTKINDQYLTNVLLKINAKVSLSPPEKKKQLNGFFFFSEI